MHEGCSCPVHAGGNGFGALPLLQAVMYTASSEELDIFVYQYIVGSLAWDSKCVNLGS